MNSISENKKAVAPFQLSISTVVVALSALTWAGCHSTPPPAPALVVSSPAPAPVAAPMDDIPASASPAIRAHLIKLREMRDMGQITDGEYQSRKAALINWKTGL
jgi:hypothetical protein